MDIRAASNGAESDWISVNSTNGIPREEERGGIKKTTGFSPETSKKKEGEGMFVDEAHESNEQVIFDRV